MPARAEFPAAESAPFQWWVARPVDEDLVDRLGVLIDDDLGSQGAFQLTHALYQVCLRGYQCLDGSGERLEGLRVLTTAWVW